MNRNEIIAKLAQNDSTVISYPDRGPWGDRSYRGNCSGWIHAFLIWKYRVEKFGEIFAGSGTGSDVCRDMEVDYIGVDLNPEPVRNNIIPMNVMADEVPDGFRDRDFIFQHPPYSSLINIDWAGKQWKDITGKLAAQDMGNLPYDEFIRAWNAMNLKFYAAMAPGAKMGILMGDIRRKGQFRSMFSDCVRMGQLEQVIIKMQHNCVSEGRSYAQKNFVPIVHEYIMVLKKVLPYMVDFELPKKYGIDIRDSESATWKDVVFAVMNEKGREVNMDIIYEEIGGHRKAEKNPNWKAKVRQVLQQLRRDGLVYSTKRGCWSVRMSAA